MLPDRDVSHGRRADCPTPTRAREDESQKLVLILQWRGPVAKVRGPQPRVATTSLSVAAEGPCAGARSKGPTTAPNLMLARPRAAHRSSLAAGAERIMFSPPPAFLLDQDALTRRATLRLPRDASLTRRDGRRVAFESLPHPRGQRIRLSKRPLRCCAESGLPALANRDPRGFTRWPPTHPLLCGV